MAGRSLHHLWCGVRFMDFMLALAGIAILAILFLYLSQAFWQLHRYDHGYDSSLRD